MKQLSSFLVLAVNGGDRVSYTYDEIDRGTGNLISTNNKESFFAVDQQLSEHIDAIRDYIRKHRLAE